MATKLLVCQQFKTPTFSNGDSRGWDERTEYVKSLQEKYGFHTGIKELFFELLQCGTAVSSVDERIEVVGTILQQEGYVVDKLTNYTGVRV